MAEYMRIEDLQVYQKLCSLRIEVCELTKSWPAEEKFKLGGQAQRTLETDLSPHERRWPSSDSQTQTRTLNPEP